MEDLSVIIKKSFFEEMYKKKTDTFGTIQERVEKMNEQRKNTRHDVVFEKRKIPLDMSPFVSPAVNRKVEKVDKNSKNTDKPVNKRLEMLIQWKAEKEKKKAEEKKAKKPLFKVTHVPLNIGLPNLESINTEIKGKPFKSKFAPPNHKFKPPKNINPINFQHIEDKPKAGANRMVTRSQARQISAKPKEKSSVTKIKETQEPVVSKPKTNKTEKSQKKPRSKENKENEFKTELKTPSRRCKSSKVEEKKQDGMEVKEKTPRGKKKSSTVEKSKDKEVDSEKNMNYLEVPERHDMNSSINVKTPEKIEPPVYISPFVTVSRGKNSARKEYEARKSGKSSSLNSTVSNPTSPKAGAAYFTWCLDHQINRLQELCDQWNKYKEEERPLEEATALIDVAIGQTNLLITKKFEQFRGLIERCKNQDIETPVTCEDLHGFWDMMHIQIDNLDKRFENLDKLKENNWEEIMPEVKTGPTKRKGRQVKVAKASAGLIEAIKAARKKKQNDNSENTDEKEVRKTPRRISSHLDAVTNNAKHRNSSPGLMMMKVAQYAKGVQTPMKSILKSDKKSIAGQSKSVLFEDKAIQDLSNTENNLNIPNSEIKGKSPSRRSSRLSKMKLF